MTIEIGSGPVTIQDVARLAGVSRAAVSKVIRNAYGVSPSMRERVTAAIDELDYRPSIAARSLRSGATFTIGIELPHIGNPFFTKVIEGATAALEATDYQLIVAPATNDPVEGSRAINALADRQVDGLVAISPLVDRGSLERIARRTPLIMLGRHDETDAYDTVTGDDVSGSRLAMEHLFALGHSRVAHITVRSAATDPSPSSPHSVRIREYERLMQETGQGQHIRIAHMRAESEGGREVTRHLLQSSTPPTAIFAGNDTLALDALQVRDELGLTAADLSIIGYDDIDIASHPSISLSTIDQGGVEMGRNAIRMLLERIEGRSDASHFQTSVKLRDRRSTASYVR